MSLSDCEKCWNTPCTCGYEYKKYSTKRLLELKNVIDKELDYRVKQVNTTTLDEEVTDE